MNSVSRTPRFNAQRSTKRNADLGVGRSAGLQTAVALGLVLVLSFSSIAGQPPLFPTTGTPLSGNQFANDCAFFFTDWDSDGKLDMVMPTPSMINFGVMINEGTVTAPRFGHNLPYDLNSTEMQPQTVEHASSWGVGDLNADGLPDAVLFDGYLRLAVNTGTANGPNLWGLWPDHPTYFPGSARMVEENARFSTGPESMNWKRGIFARQAVTLTIADWDGDGLNDLIVSRFKSEAPGVVSAGRAQVQWTALGRMIAGMPKVPPPPTNSPTFRGPLDQAPARGLYVYLNQGTRSRPWFDLGLEVCTADGASIAAPNPELADMDGDGIPDIVSSEVAYACNAYRVDWPTAPSVQWYRRVGRGASTRVEAARPVMDYQGAAIPAGVSARMADLRQAGKKDLFVLDPARGVRWYQRAGKGGGEAPAFTPPTVIRGSDFSRFTFMYQPMVANWTGPKSRDLILHGSTDHHCKWDLRRTALYRNRAPAPGTPDYEFAGYINYRGDPEMVPKAFEDSSMAVYGSAAWVPECPDGKKRMLMSVEGQVYLFTQLAADGLTFQERQKLDIPNPGRNRCTGWQEIPVAVTGGVQYIRLTPGGGKGNLGEGGVKLVALEALVNGSNVATWAAGTRVAPGGVVHPEAMLTPGHASGKGVFTTINSPGIVVLPASANVSKLRFLLYDGSGPATPGYLPFYWQGTLYPFGFRAAGELWYQYKVEVSADAKQWTTVSDRLTTEMLRSFPCAVDWNGDGRFDLVLGVLNGQELTPATREYRLYLNSGDNDHPVFDNFSSLNLEDGKPMAFPANRDAYDHQCSVMATDLNGDGKPDLVVGQTRVAMTYYENVSAQAGDYRFRRVKDLGDPQPIRCTDENRTFFVGDVDGDGITDLINNNSASIYFSYGPVLFKGAAVATTPPMVTAAAAPVRRVVLRNGLQCPAGGAVYTGNVAYALSGARPDTVDRGAHLVAVASSALVPGVILLRFDQVPKETPIGSAALELTIPGTAGPLPPWVTCSAIRSDWDVTSVTYAESAPGKPWGESELIAGGDFQSRMDYVATWGENQTIRWDVTRAVQAAQREGCDTVSLVLRRDYTGKYSIGNGYTFAGAMHPSENWRPRLILTVVP